MRKNTARHWLHAGLDLLPLILIPVFMIYSHRHTMTTQTTVDISYKYQSNDVESYDDLIEGNIYHIDEWSINLQGNEDDGQFEIVSIGSYDVDYLNLTYDEVYVAEYNSSNYNNIYVYFSDDYCNMSFSNSNGYVTMRYEGFVGTFYDIDFVFYDSQFMFDKLDGFTVERSDFNVIESVEVHDETSSVMNVFMDNFNGAIDKYFNMGNVFGMTNVYQWLNTNIFSGNAPTIIFSVWNIVLYEFVIDLIFLLYALFMWFIDVTKRLIEKPLDSIK